TERGRRLCDLVVRAHLDAVLLGRRDDLLARAFLGGLALELGLVPAGHRVSDMRFVVQRKVALAFRVDVRERALAKPFAVCGVELSHGEKLLSGSGSKPCCAGPVDGGASCSRDLLALTCRSAGACGADRSRSEEHTSELQSLRQLVCRLLLEKEKM